MKDDRIHSNDWFATFLMGFGLILKFFVIFVSEINAFVTG